jgi:hypothetical protein
MKSLVLTKSQSKPHPYEEAKIFVLLDDADELGCREALRNVDAFADGDLDNHKGANLNRG